LIVAVECEGLKGRRGAKSGFVQRQLILKEGLGTSGWWGWKKKSDVLPHPSHSRSKVRLSSATMDLSVIIVIATILLFFFVSVVDSFFRVRVVRMHPISGRQRDVSSGAMIPQGINVGNTNGTAIVKTINDNRFRCAEPDRRPISPELSRCQTTKAFISYALRRGATLYHNRGGNHVKVSKGTISCTFAGGLKGTKSVKQLASFMIKEHIEAFKAMGIAWD